MKTIMFLLLLAMSSIASAQQQRDPTDEEFKWVFLSHIAESPDSIQWYGLSDESAKKVVEFAIDIHAKDEAFAKQYAAEACQQKGKTMEQLARYFDQLQGEPDAYWAKLMEGLPALLEPGEEDTFWRAAHENMAMGVGDAAKPSDVVREQRISTDEIAEAYCK